MVFQMPMESFDPRCTLGDGIGESLRNMGISRTETRRKVEELLERCGLEKEYADRYPPSGKRWSVPESCNRQSTGSQSVHSDLS